MNGLIYIKSNNLLQDAQQIIETAQGFAYRAVNTALLQRNWLLGKRIAEEELQGKERAEYGAEVIKKLSVELTQIYGKGFTKTNLYTFTEFYKSFPNIFHAVIGKSSDNNLDTTGLKSSNQILDSVSPKSSSKIFQSVIGKSFSLLSWTHYFILLQVKDTEARNWYMNEATEQTWSVRTLQRNISSQYYFRLLQSHNKELVKDEMKQKTASFQQEGFIYPFFTTVQIVAAGNDSEGLRFRVINAPEKYYLEWKNFEKTSDTWRRNVETWRATSLQQTN